MTIKHNTPEKILTEIAAVGSLNAKKAILQREAAAKNEVFFEGCRMALDNQIVYHVKQVPEKLTDNRSELLWSDFKTLTQALTNRDITGHAALREITKIMDAASKVEWNGWYRRILQKDLKARFGLDLLNDAISDTKFVVRSFECMLAHDSKDRLDKVLTGKKAIEIKYDGVRTLAFYTPGKPIVCYSRNGKVFKNFQQIEKSLGLLLHNCKEPMVLDGEVVSSSFNSLMTQVNRKSDAKLNDALYVIFDMLPQSEFREGKSVLNYLGRRAMMKKILLPNLAKYDNLTITEPTFIDFAIERKQFDKLKADVLEAGYEGLIVKDPEAVYECKRSKAWMKIKPFIEVTLTVKSVYEGEKDSEREGTLGGFRCEGVEDGKNIIVNVGSGFSKEQIEEYWKNQKKIVGMKVEVRADAISQNQDGGYSLRFPRFKYFRGFKKGEKF